jgi:serine protease Do
LRLGDFVFAIGNALGKYQGSVTMGIVSALSRDVSVNGEGMKMLQTDAALNSGNSGGGLFDSSGNLVGIVAAKDADESSEGVGFAIPTDVAKVVIEDIIKHGYVTGRPTLGFSTVDITSMREASYYGVDWIGVYISSVVKDGYGEKAGLKPRDYIYSVNSEVITTTDRIKEILEESKVGDTLLLEVWRGSDAIDVVLVIGEEVS